MNTEKATTSVPIHEGGSSPATIAAAVCLFLLPLTQFLIFAAPFWMIRGFLTSDMLLSMLGQTVVFSHSGIIGGILMALGGILLLMKVRTGWTLGLAGTLYCAVVLVETLLYLIIMALSNDSSLEFYRSMVWEYLSLSYFIPIIQALLIIATLYLLLSARVRRLLVVSRSNIWWAVGIGALLVIEQNTFLVLALNIFE